MANAATAWRTSTGGAFGVFPSNAGWRRRKRAWRIKNGARADLRSVRCNERMTLYAVFENDDLQILVTGDRAGLYGLAALLAGGQLATLSLDQPPPPALQAQAQALDAIEVRPNVGPDGRVSFARSGRRLVIGGDGAEIARIVAEPIADLADGPAAINTISA